jgi:hypothetical protein
MIDFQRFPLIFAKHKRDCRQQEKLTDHTHHGTGFTLRQGVALEM